MRQHSAAGVDRGAARCDGAGHDPHVLPVPLPAERRNVDTDFEHLAGRLHCVVRERGDVIFDATSHLAGLEIGSLPGKW